MYYRYLALALFLLAPMGARAEDTPPWPTCFQCLLNSEMEDETWREELLPYMRMYRDDNKTSRGTRTYTFRRPRYDVKVTGQVDTDRILFINILPKYGPYPELDALLKTWGMRASLDDIHADAANGGPALSLRQNIHVPVNGPRIHTTSLDVELEPGGRDVLVEWEGRQKKHQNLKRIHLSGTMPQEDPMCAQACFVCPDDLPFDPWTANGVDLTDPSTIAPLFTESLFGNACERALLGTKHQFTGGHLRQTSPNGKFEVVWLDHNPHDYRRPAAEIDYIRIPAEHLGFMGLSTETTRQELWAEYGATPADRDRLTHYARTTNLDGVVVNFDYFFSFHADNRLHYATVRRNSDRGYGILPDAHAQLVRKPRTAQAIAAAKAEADANAAAEAARFEHARQIQAEKDRIRAEKGDAWVREQEVRAIALDRLDKMYADAERYQTAYLGLSSAYRMIVQSAAQRDANEEAFNTDAAEAYSALFDLEATLEDLGNHLPQEPYCDAVREVHQEAHRLLKADLAALGEHSTARYTAKYGTDAWFQEVNRAANENLYEGPGRPLKVVGQIAKSWADRGCNNPEVQRE
jgi:hypothetical protein